MVLKWLSLLVLSIQNSALVLVMKQSSANTGFFKKTLFLYLGPTYFSATAVVQSEFLKLLVSFIMIKLFTNDKITFRTVFSLDAFNLLIPTLLYLIQNNLQYYAVQKLSPPTFQLTYQLKILTTAFFFVLVLGKRLNLTQVVSLVVLLLGVGLVQYHDVTEKEMDDQFDKVLGFVAVFIACCLSGLAGVWFEKVLKTSNVGLWTRNFQLSFFSFVVGYFSGIHFSTEIAEKGFYYNYNNWTFITILIQAFGGLLVAIVVKYADNILKGFATSLSIIFSSIASVYLFDFEITLNFVFGSILIIGATVLYSVGEFGKNDDSFLNVKGGSKKFDLPHHNIQKSQKMNQH